MTGVAGVDDSIGVWIGGVPLASLPAPPSSLDDNEDGNVFLSPPPAAATSEPMSTSRQPLSLIVRPSPRHPPRAPQAARAPRRRLRVFATAVAESARIGSHRAMPDLPPPLAPSPSLPLPPTLPLAPPSAHRRCRRRRRELGFRAGATAMDEPTAYRNLRGPSPFVLAMKTRLAPPPPLSDPPPLPAVPPSLLPPLLPLPEKRRRGRPRNCDRLPPPPGFFAPPPPPQAPTLLPAPLLAHGQGQSRGGLHPHVLQIDAGEEIIPKITALSKSNGRVICVLSVLGAVQEATLLLSSGVTTYHKGPLEIIRFFGSILTPNDQGCLRVTLASGDSSVIGGVITGPLKAATPVQAVVASFYSNVYWPNRTPKIVAHYPNSQCTIRNGSTLSSERVNPGYASCAAVDQYESSEVDVKPSLGVLNLASL